MFEKFVVHSKKIQIVSWKRDCEIFPTGTNRIVKTKAEFFKDLLPGDIIVLSFELDSTSSYKAVLVAEAWRGDEYIGKRADTFNKIANGMYCFNLKEL